MSEINNYISPEYQNRINQYQDSGNSQAVTGASSEDNFVDQINERLGTGDRTAIAELEARGIPTVVSEMSNGYKVEYTYSRVKYSVTYFEPSESNKNEESVSGSDNKTTGTQNTVPEHTFYDKNKPNTSATGGTTATNATGTGKFENWVDPNDIIMIVALLKHLDRNFPDIKVDPETGKLVNTNQNPLGGYGNIAADLFDETGTFSVAKAKELLQSKYGVTEIGNGIYSVPWDDTAVVNGQVGHFTSYNYEIYDPETRQFYNIGGYSGRPLPETHKPTWALSNEEWIEFQKDNQTMTKERYNELCAKSSYMKNALDQLIADGKLSLGDPITRPPMIGDVEQATVTTSDNVKHNVLYSYSGKESTPEESAARKQTTLQTIRNFYADYRWPQPGWSIDDISAFEACIEIRPGVWGTKDENGNYEIKYYKYCNGSSTVLKKAPLPTESEILDDIMRLRASKDSDPNNVADQLAELYLAMTGEKSLEIIQNDRGEYITYSSENKYLDARPDYKYNNAGTVDGIPDIVNNPNFRFAAGDKRRDFVELQPGVWGIKGENGEPDTIYGFYNGKDIVEFGYTTYRYSDGSELIMDDYINMYTRCVEGSFKGFNSHERGGEYIYFSDLLVDSHPVPTEKELIELIMNTTGAERDAYARLYMAVTGKDSVELYKNSNGDIVTSSDETKSKPEAKNPGGLATSIDELIENKEGVNWLIEHLGLNKASSYDRNDIPFYRDKSVLDYPEEFGLVKDENGTVYLTPESLFTYYTLGSGHDTINDLLHLKLNPQDDKTNEEFIASLNDYLKSIGGTTIDGQTYMVTFEQLVKAYVEFEDVDFTIENVVHNHNLDCVERTANNAKSADAYDTVGTPDSLFDAFEPAFAYNHAESVEDYIKYGQYSYTDKPYNGISQESFEKYILSDEVPRTQLPKGFMLLDIMCKRCNVKSYDDFIKLYKEVEREWISDNGVEQLSKSWRILEYDTLINEAFRYFGYSEAEQAKLQGSYEKYILYEYLDAMGYLNPYKKS